MNTTALIAFAITFVAGPLVCALVLRLPARVPLLAGLAASVVVAMGAAVRLQTSDVTMSLAAMWLAWVLAVAMVAQALRRRVYGQTRRWVTVLALLATTLPWFGLATARMMTGA
ncbi:hypothetical protein [Tropicibacter naphthalenivorans]|uniref:Uncharacterized protein n=1 Tax=Tropicibacter naphthalenivorans TaxID=441103 RepID=A0A0P1GDS6_9RHOB|nr:hypothetical protein [Tropicibacter naphthalenivorans]CUH79342.1 hypothetical protein TRN7648_02422 [Tropicibacter naphthalenivorans]SMC71437.1 hypothetical protein SAMN04488093_10352 [Tropicibacter naphthalenivorans]